MARIKVISYIETNTKEYKKPNEDYIHISSDGYFAAVADGSTRIHAKGTYSELSARIASECFCYSMVANYESGMRICPAMFANANYDIGAINQWHGVTEEAHLIGCLGVAGHFHDNEPDRFYYGYIGDCGLLVFAKDLSCVTITPNRIEPLELFRDRSWRTQEERDILWRTTLRNKPDRRYVTYGLLNGEEEAIQYVEMGHVALEPGDTVLLFTDGILPFVYSEGFRSVVRQCLRDGLTAGPVMQECIGYYSSVLRKNSIKNWDDDKAFVAFSYEY